MGAERDRVDVFGKLENGLRQAGDWYRWGLFDENEFLSPHGLRALSAYHRSHPYTLGSGSRLTLDKVAADLQDRLISIFTRGPDGRRPCFGGTALLQDDPAWRDNLVFAEYFHGDNAAALGAGTRPGGRG